MIHTRCNLSNRAAYCYGSGWWGRPVCCVAIPKPTTAVQPPAVQRTSSQQRTCVVPTSCNLSNRAAHCHGSRYWGIPLRSIAIPQLTIAIITPAAHRTSRQQRTRVVITSCNLSNSATHCYTSRCCGGPLSSITITKLAFAVIPPAAQRNSSQQYTGVSISSCSRHRQYRNGWRGSD